MPSQTAFFPKGLPLVERLAVNLAASLLVLGMNNLGETSAKISLRAAREVQPKLIEINGLSGATGWPFEILRAGGSIKVRGRQVMESLSAPILRTQGVCPEEDLQSVTHHESA
jgi:hypothetical protein